MWPFRRARRPSPTGPRSPVREWASVPPIQRTVAVMDGTFGTASFEQELATRLSPQFLEPLGHEVSPAAPTGVMSNVLTPTPSPAAGARTEFEPPPWRLPTPVPEHVDSAHVPPTHPANDRPSGGAPVQRAATLPLVSAPPLDGALRHLTEVTPSLPTPAGVPALADAPVPREEVSTSDAPAPLVGDAPLALGEKGGPASGSPSSVEGAGSLKVPEAPLPTLGVRRRGLGAPIQREVDSAAGGAIEAAPPVPAPGRPLPPSTATGALPTLPSPEPSSVGEHGGVPGTPAVPAVIVEPAHRPPAASPAPLLGNLPLVTAAPAAPSAPASPAAPRSLPPVQRQPASPPTRAAASGTGGFPPAAAGQSPPPLSPTTRAVAQPGGPAAPASSSPKTEQASAGTDTTPLPVERLVPTPVPLPLQRSSGRAVAPQPTGLPLPPPPVARTAPGTPGSDTFFVHSATAGVVQRTKNPQDVGGPSSGSGDATVELAPRGAAAAVPGPPLRLASLLSSRPLAPATVQRSLIEEHRRPAGATAERADWAGASAPRRDPSGSQGVSRSLPAPAPISRASDPVRQHGLGPVLQRSSPGASPIPGPAAAALSTGLATLDSDGSVVFAPPSAPPSTAPPAVQRQAEAAEAVLPATATAAAAEGPAAPSPAGGAGAQTDEQLEELARNLYDKIRGRLKAELRLDRERSGRVVDLAR